MCGPRAAAHSGCSLIFPTCLGIEDWDFYLDVNHDLHAVCINFFLHPCLLSSSSSLSIRSTSGETNDLA